MCPNNFVLIIISALVLLAHSSPSNIDRITSQYDSNSVAQNEKILKLFLQLAMHTANRLMNLRNNADKEYDCNRYNDITLSPSTTKTPITQLPLEASLERPDENQDKIQSRLFFSDLKENNNVQTSIKSLDTNQKAFQHSTQELFDKNDSQNNASENISRNLNSMASDLIPKSLQDIQNPILAVKRNEIFNSDTLQESVNLNMTNDLFSANKFNPDARDSPIYGISERYNPITVQKNVSNAKIMGDLTKTVNKLFPRTQNLPESALGTSYRLNDTDLEKNIPATKIVSDLHESMNKYTSQSTQESLNRTNDVSPRFFNSVSPKPEENILNPQIKDNVPVLRHILTNVRNTGSMIKVLPENAKSANNSQEQIIPKFQSFINTPFETFGDQKYISSNNISNNVSDPSLLHNLTSQVNQLAEESYSDENIRRSSNLSSTLNNLIDAKENASQRINTFENDNQERINDLPINTDNSKVQSSNDQFISATSINQENISNQLFRSLPNFNNYKNDDKKTRNNFSFTQTNENTDIASTISSTISSLVVEHQEKSSNFIQNLQDSGDVNNMKTNLEQLKKRKDNSSANDKIIQLMTDNNLSELDFRFIDNLEQSENLHEQLSEANLREISDRLLNVLQPIMEQEMTQTTATNVK